MNEESVHSQIIGEMYEKTVPGFSVAAILAGSQKDNNRLRKV